MGENLTVDGTDITKNAPAVSILTGAAINGPLTIGTGPVCP